MKASHMKLDEMRHNCCAVSWNCFIIVSTRRTASPHYKGWRRGHISEKTLQRAMFVKVETGDDSLRQETQHAEIRTRKIMFVTMKLFSKSSLALPMNNQQRHSHGDKQPISFRSLQMVACKANKEQ